MRVGLGLCGRDAGLGWCGPHDGRVWVQSANPPFNATVRRQPPAECNKPAGLAVFPPPDRAQGRAGAVVGSGRGAGCCVHWGVVWALLHSLGACAFRRPGPALTKPTRPVAWRRGLCPHAVAGPLVRLCGPRLLMSAVGGRCAGGVGGPGVGGGLPLDVGRHGHRAVGCGGRCWGRWRVRRLRGHRGRRCSATKPRTSVCWTGPLWTGCGAEAAGMCFVGRHRLGRAGLAQSRVATHPRTRAI